MTGIIDGASFQRMIIHAAASINGQKQLINELNVPVYVAENALSCVAEGTGVMLENLHLVR